MQQINHAKKCIEAAQNEHIPRIVFIHGKGTGVLKTELRNMLSNTYELQLKSSSEYLSSMTNMQELQESIKSVMNDLAASAGDTQAYRENMATLSQNLSDLNNVYGNMLKAMRS